MWRSKADGSERVQLTFVPLRVMNPHGFQDGERILFYGGGRDEIYIVSAEGGKPLPVAKTPGSK